MLHLHEAWREEAGWLLAVIGGAGLFFGLVEAVARGFAPAWSSTPWLGALIAGVFILVGLGLHYTRPKTRSRPQPPAEPHEDMPPESSDQTHLPAH